MKGLHLLIVLTLAVASCKDGPSVPNGNINPPNFQFIVLGTDGKPIFGKTTPVTLIYYFHNGEKLAVDPRENYINRFQDSSRYKYYYNSLGMSLVSKNNGNRYFYLDYAGKVDTIYLDVQTITTPAADPRRGSYFINEVKFNGQVMTIDQSFMPWVYIFKRK